MMLIGIGHISVDNFVKKRFLSINVAAQFSYKLVVYCTSCMIFIKLYALLLSTCVLLKLLPHQLVVCFYYLKIKKPLWTLSLG